MSNTIEITKEDFGYYLEFALQQTTGVILNLSGADLYFFLKKDSTLIINPTVPNMDIVSAGSGTCHYLVKDEDFEDSGIYVGEIRAVIFGKVLTFPNILISVKNSIA